MPCNDWFNIERQFRIAVHTYSDAVDRLDSARDFEGAWKRIESARVEADRARSALLGHQREHHCVPLRALAARAATSDTEQFSEMEEEMILLGDQGQPGG